MTAIELRTSIADDLQLLSVDLLQKVAAYVKRQTAQSVGKNGRAVEITSGVERLRMGYSVPAKADLNKEINDYLEQKYQ